MPDGVAAGVPAPVARRTDPVTSHEAAALKSGSGIAELLRTIYVQFWAWDPYDRTRVTGESSMFHDGQLAEIMGKERGIVARDRGLLVEAGYVGPVMLTTRQQDGTRATHQATVMGNRGRRVLVWEMTEEGAYEGRRLQVEHIERNRA